MTEHMSVGAQSAAAPLHYKSMNRRNCRYCVGASQGAAGQERADIQPGCICDITHKKITERELENGCEDYYDNRYTAFFIDVRLVFTYLSHYGRVLGSETFTDRVIRVRQPPSSLDDWRSIYQEALNYRLERMPLKPVHADWACANVYSFEVWGEARCRGDNIRRAKVNCTGVVNGFPQGVNQDVWLLQSN